MSAPKLVKRGAVWHVRFTAANGARVRCSARTADRAEAEEFAARVWSEAYRVAALGQRPRYCWDDAVVRWIQDHAHKRSLPKDRGNLRWLDPHLRGMALDSIDTEYLRRIRSARLSEDLSIMRRGTAGPATANRTMSLVRSILNAAAGWGWIDRVPVVPMSPEVREEPRYLERDAATAFVAELPEHLQPIAQFGLATGLREQNILRLRWAAVDIEARAAWVSNCETKAAKSLRVPLSSEAVVVLRRQRELVPRACPWVFPSSCAAGLPEYRPFARVVSTAWRNARDRAGVPWLTFHHLRHTWASWHVMAGTPLEVLQRLGGWSSLAMVMRYAHLSESHVDAYADRAGGLRAVQQQSAEATRKRK